MKIYPYSKKLLTVTLISVCGLFYSVSASTVLISSESVDSNEGWIRTGAGTAFFSTGTGGLTPQVGSRFVVNWNNNTFNTVHKDFQTSDFTAPGLAALGGTNTWAAGTYTFTIQVGHPNQQPDFASDVLPFLAIHNGATESWDNRIAASAVTTTSEPIPGIGEWTTWTLEYNIDSTTVTNNGTSVLGQPIGAAFRVRAGNTGGYAIDGVELSFVPEPRAAALAFGLVMIAFITFRKFRRQ